MKKTTKSIVACAAFLGVALGASNGVAAEVAFGGERGAELLVDGKPVQLRAGELEPQRIPRAYWRHRVKMCKAMGLNAISSYFMWNDFEQPDGTFNFKGDSRDVAAFLSICKEEGMWVLFRPGPYVCAEWDFGGIPSRLLKEDVAVRSTDPRYLAEVEKYLAAIAAVAKPYLAKNGGPIVLTQIENEYGSWSFKDVAYLKWLKDFWKRHGFGPFYMADGAGDSYLRDLIYPDAEIAVGFDPGMSQKAWDLAQKYNPGVPVLSSETYPGWLRHWGEGNWRPSDITPTVRWFMEGRRSFCLFVAHGGTSFGFTSGANCGGVGGYEPDLTSYDYGAPIDEQGRATKAYFAYRKIIFDALGQEPPPIPDEIPSLSFAAVVPSRHANLRDNVAKEIASPQPLYFEQMDQNQGMAFYRTDLPAGDAAELDFDRLADYAQVWLDGQRLATVDRRLKKVPVAVPARTRPAVLEILVEAMGHVNFGRGMRYDRKGVVGNVRLGTKTLSNWRIALKPLTERSIAEAKPSKALDGFAGGHYRAVVNLDAVADTFIDMSKWKKGVVYVNGRNIGRYWSIGPQYSLYCPAPFLVKGVNQIDIVDLELAEAAPIRGLPRPVVRDSSVNTENTANVW